MALRACVQLEPIFTFTYVTRLQFNANVTFRTSSFGLKDTELCPSSCDDLGLR